MYAAKPGSQPERRFSGQVAKSTHAGIPWLNRIREGMGERVHFDPPLTVHERALAAREGWILGIA